MKQSQIMRAASCVALIALVSACSTGSENRQADASEDPAMSARHDQEPMQFPDPAAATAEAGKASSDDAMTLTQAQLANENVLNQMHHINSMEIALNQLAVERGQSQQVKDAAKHMAQDHQALEKRVEEVAKAKSVELRAFQPSTYEKLSQERLEKLSGSRFDQSFLASMAADHRMATEQLQLARGQIQDTDVVGLIQEALPKIQEHQRMSASLANSATGGMAGKAGETEKSEHIQD